MSPQRPCKTLSDAPLALSLFLEAMFRGTSASDRPATVTLPQAAHAADAKAVRSGNLVPAWGRSAFDALEIDLDLLKLALPLSGLTRILAWPPELVRLPGQPPWLLGALTHQGRNVKVVDTGVLVAPAGQARTAAPAYRHIAVLEANVWGLACCSVAEVFRLEPARIRWSRRSPGRPWLAGMLVDRLSGLLDCQAFIQWLEAGAGAAVLPGHPGTKNASYAGSASE